MNGLFPADELSRIRNILILWIIAFVFHTILDPVTTYIAVVIMNSGYETNPFLQGWLHEGFYSFLLIHLPLYGMCLVGLIVLPWLFRQAGEYEQTLIYYLSVTVFGGVILWGALLILNNLLVIGQSLY